jgi:hypothetical protein
MDVLAYAFSWGAGHTTRVTAVLRRLRVVGCPGYNLLHETRATGVPAA